MVNAEVAVLVPLPDNVRLLYITAPIVWAAPLYSTVPELAVNVQLDASRNDPPTLKSPALVNVMVSPSSE